MPLYNNYKIMSFKKFYNIVYDDKGRRHWTPSAHAELNSQKPDEKKKTVNIDFSKPLEARKEDQILLKPVGVATISKDNINSEKYLGYYCKLCDFSGKDNHSWLDHLNSLGHNRQLGNHMKVERITADTVSDYLSKKQKINIKKPAPKLEDIMKRLEEDQPHKKPKLAESENLET